MMATWKMISLVVVSLFFAPLSTSCDSSRSKKNSGKYLKDESDEELKGKIDGPLVTEVAPELKPTAEKSLEPEGPSTEKTINQTIVPPIQDGPDPQEPPSTTGGESDGVAPETGSGDLSTEPEQIPFRIKGKTMTQCNDEESRVWLPLPQPEGSPAKCGIPLAQWECSLENSQKMVVAPNIKTDLEEFLKEYEGYKLYNCGEEAGFGQLHFMKEQGQQFFYATYSFPI